MALPNPTEVHPSTSAVPNSITLRAVVLGLGVSALISAWTTYAGTGVETSDVNITHLPISLFSLFIIVATVSFFLRRQGANGLTRSELLTIVAMGLVAGTIPARGMTGIWLGFMSVPFYRGTPENGWIDYIQPHLQTYLFPTNEGRQMTLLYEGLPAGAEIPWNV